MNKKLEINLNEFDFSPGRKLDTINIDFYKPLNKFRKWDLVEELLVVYYGDWEIFIGVDWFPVGDKKDGAFYIEITTKYFGDNKFYLKKTRRMNRLRKYVLEAHEYAQNILIKMNEPGFRLKEHLLTKSQIKAIKNSPPDTFINDYPPR